MEEYEKGFERAYNERLDRQNQEYLLDINNVTATFFCSSLFPFYREIVENIQHIL